jgi:hypothetical protein
VLAQVLAQVLAHAQDCPSCGIALRCFLFWYAALCDGTVITFIAEKSSIEASCHQAFNPAVGRLEEYMVQLVQY